MIEKGLKKVNLAKVVMEIGVSEGNCYQRLVSNRLQHVEKSTI